jgi:hypothetical protein
LGVVLDVSAYAIPEIDKVRARSAKRSTEFLHPFILMAHRLRKNYTLKKKVLLFFVI